VELSEQLAEVTQEHGEVPEIATAHIHGPLNAAMWQNLVANSRVEPEPPEQTEQAEPPEAASPEAEPFEGEN
jgi:hypothetical protein